MATKHFYYFCLIGITLIGGCFILLLKHKFKKGGESKGMLLISLGLFSFATIGFYKLFDPPLPQLLLSDIDRIFSVFTNIFFVAALPFFSKVFVKFRAFVPMFRKTDLWVNSVFIFFAFVTALFAVISRNVESEFGKNIIIAIDSFFSTITFGLIAYAIYKSIVLIWSDLLSKTFFGFILTILPLSQILLPLTVLFPEQFGPYYFSFLIVLLIGVLCFICSSIIYYSISNLSFSSSNIDEEVVEASDTLQVEFLNLGFDSLKKIYFIEIGFIQNNNRFSDRIENRKILIPFSNWILFSVAKKLNVKLLNQDIALTKFRMVEYWNKESEIKLNQEILFTNDMGFFEFNVEPNAIQIENIDQLKSKHIITEAIQKHSENFAPLITNNNHSKIETNDLFELIEDDSSTF